MAKYPSTNYRGRITRPFLLAGKWLRGERMETKFLSDGRKVVIVGQLNNQETIIQEVFVTAEDGKQLLEGNFNGKA